MLDTVPPEILANIAHHLCAETLQPPTALLLTSKHFYQNLSPSENPNFYAEVFRDNFDTSAATRRLSGGQLDSETLTAELEHRVRSLDRLGRLPIGQLEDKDLWVLFILLVEHDRKNLTHLFSPTFNLLEFLKRFSKENFLAAAIGPGYPTETASRAIAMWIAWILHTYGIGQEETIEEVQERMFVLRPYVFAAHRYSAYLAPWTLHDLPAAEVSRRGVRGELADHPFLADMSLRSRGKAVQYFGRSITIGPPAISHAAILRFFKPTKDEDLDSDDNEDDDDELEGGDSPSNMSLRNLIHPTPPILNGKLAISRRISPAVAKITHASTLHDRDWQRMTSCYDPSRQPGMRVKDWQHAFEGCWEGNFSFFEFESFKAMVAGDQSALYEGPYGLQAQVWKITETFVWPIKDRPKPKPASPPAIEEDWVVDDEDEDHALGDRKGKGKAKETDLELDTAAEGKRGLPLHGPATNAGFPTDVSSSARAGLATPSAEQSTLDATIKQQLEAIEGYEIVPANELDAALERDEPGMEVLLTGTGHSAWGRFILKGRVRTWDGMATLVKEYAPDSRGKWIYRGYVTAGDVMVGRWRDTFTPEEFIGYEGTFFLNRRE